MGLFYGQTCILETHSVLIGQVWTSAFGSLVHPREMAESNRPWPTLKTPFAEPPSPSLDPNENLQVWFHRKTTSRSPFQGPLSARSQGSGGPWLASSMEGTPNAQWNAHKHPFKTGECATIKKDENPLNNRRRTPLDGFPERRREFPFLDGRFSLCRHPMAIQWLSNSCPTVV